MKRNSISHLAIDKYLWDVQENIMKKHGYGFDQSYNVLYPLSYYINTGRASTEFLHNMQFVKPYVIARILVKGYEHGTVDECIAAFKKKVEDTMKKLVDKSTDNVLQ